MTVEEKKEEIKRIKKIIQSSINKKIGIGFTYIEVEGPFLKINHTAGAYGKTFEEIDERLSNLGIPKIEELKEMFEVYKEGGDPKNHYILILRMKARDKDKVKIVKAKRISNLPNTIKL